MSITVIITFIAKPEKLAPFEAILRSVKTNLPGVPGCNGLQIFSKADEPCAFTLVELWSSVEVHKSYIARVVASGDWERMASHLACDPMSSYFRAF
jgi:quinol monooxygenase YgiN